MSDSSPQPQLRPMPALELLGDAVAMVCEGDVCEVPTRPEAQIVVERVDAHRA